MQPDSGRVSSRTGGSPPFPRSEAQALLDRSVLQVAGSSSCMKGHGGSWGCRQGGAPTSSQLLFETLWPAVALPGLALGMVSLPALGPVSPTAPHGQQCLSEVGSSFHSRLAQCEQACADWATARVGKREGMGPEQVDVSAPEAG